eukprot:4904714-Alexandrium_andersonii.AAC.1
MCHQQLKPRDARCLTAGPLPSAKELAEGIGAVANEEFGIQPHTAADAPTAVELPLLPPP